MRFLILILFPAYFYSQKDTVKTEVKDEIHYLTKYFIKTPGLIVSGDSIVFISTPDSTIIVDQVWTDDTTKLWVHYRDQSSQDFWKIDMRNKYGNDTSVNKQLNKTPTKYIREYFADNHIKLLDVFIYYSLSGNLSFDYCVGCYGGSDYLFKIQKEDYGRLIKVTRVQLRALKNNYRRTRNNRSQANSVTPPSGR